NEIEMIEAAGRDRHADEHAPGEKTGGDELQPQEWIMKRAGYAIAKYVSRESADGNSAQHHQRVLDRVKRAPFQVSMAGNDKRRLERAFDDNFYQAFPRFEACRRGRPRAATLCTPPPSSADHFTLRTSSSS